MPGAYTHITHARLLTGGNLLKNMKLPTGARTALLEYPEFCRMGAISPDYPYLRIIGGSEDAEHLANAMHHKYGILTKKNILHIGVEYLRKVTGDEQSKCVSWFLGYASHIVADVTCHPVTNLLVGDYEADNQTAHRASEMHQDVYIYTTRLGGDVRNSEEIKNVIGTCTEPQDKNKVDSQIEKIWRHLLSKSFPEIANRFAVDIHGWHKAVQFFIDNIAEELSYIPSRHVRAFVNEKAIAYPLFDELDRDTYIDRLRTPKRIKTYDQIFDHTNRNIKKVWKLLSEGIFRNDDSYREKVDLWNLDTGQAVVTQKIMWEKLV